MKNAICSQSIMVAPTDINIPFIMHTIPHLLDRCSYLLLKRLLTIDKVSRWGDNSLRSGIVRIEQLWEY